MTLGLTEEVEHSRLSDDARLSGTRIKHPMKGILQRGEVPRMPTPRHSASLSFGLHKFSLGDMDQVAPDLPVRMDSGLPLNHTRGPHLAWVCHPTTGHTLLEKVYLDYILGCFIFIAGWRGTQ